MRPLVRPKDEYRSAQHEGSPMNRTCDRASARTRALGWAARRETHAIKA